MSNTAILPSTPIHPGCKLETDSAELSCYGSGAILRGFSLCRSSMSIEHEQARLSTKLSRVDRSAAIRPNVGLYSFGLSDLTQRHHPETGQTMADPVFFHSETFSKLLSLVYGVCLCSDDASALLECNCVFEFLRLGYANMPELCEMKD
jgi:hypothetical protein